MAEKTRADLKNLFLKGTIPTERDFHDFIESGINKHDDGVYKNKGEGIRIHADGPNRELINFFDNINDLNPAWVLNEKSEDGNEGFNISEPNGGSRLFIEKGGNIGIGLTRPTNKLDVAGMVGMEGRKGSFAFGDVPADGQWHDVLSELNEYQAFEVIASVGKKGAHSILHAIAVSTYGQSKSAITKTCGYYGWAKNKIDIRWSGSYFSYQLQIRTKTNYGEGVLVKYNIAKLY
ncbi:MAG: hypothetical protein K0S33_1747 [Bacteroidetes bacterium]|jgi:hypothetical protein|nr:hypothetical protein [Bacteroidota bacterium]